MRPSRKFAKSKAFSLLETMVALLVTVICLSLLSSCLKLFSLFEKDRHDPNELAFSYVQFAKFLKKDSRRTYIDLDNSNPMKIEFVKEGKEADGKKAEDVKYVLEADKKSNNLRVRKAGTDGGNMTLLPVWAASFAAKDGLMEVHINEHGKRSILYFKVDKAPEKEKEAEQKKKEQTEPAKGERPADQRAASGHDDTAD
ncbi:hypothetical protein [Lactobacillus nasalidis]|nr:hypothetical protein [Lactobacillus nasalidis]